MQYTYYILLLLMISVSQLVAQNPEIGNNYFFKTTGGPEGALQFQDGTPPDENVQIRRGHQIKVSHITEDTIFFTYIPFSNANFKEVYNTANPTADSVDALYIFSLPKEDFLVLTSPLYDRFRGFHFGTYTVPIRLRSTPTGNLTGDQTEFDGNLFLGANGVVRFGLSQYYEHRFVDLSIGIGISKVNLTPENSDIGSGNGDFADVEALSPAALTTSFGLLFNLAANVNGGVYLGWDRLSSADQRTGWVYNREHWWGFGLNVTFGTGTNETDGGNTQ